MTNNRVKSRQRSQRLLKEYADGAFTEVRCSTDWERLDVEWRFLKPCRVIDDEDEGAETDLTTHERIAAGRHGEGEKTQTYRKSPRRLPQGGRQLSWV